MTPPRTFRLGSDSEETALAAAADALRRGRLVIIPTETVYGVAADPRVTGAEERIYRAKARDRGKPLPLLAASLGDVERQGAVFGPVERALAERFWPGALTIVLATPAGPEGFRVPACDVARKLIDRAGGVLRVTSANLSGEPPALTADEAVAALGPHVEVVLDAGPVPGGVPSTVVKVENGRVLILREGVVDADALKAL